MDGTTRDTIGNIGIEWKETRENGREQNPGNKGKWK